ncbi:hypothetical protein L195_g044660 [Trifolium pratense]|uniref:Cysteine-rich receptor-like protein kinase n=1 Tax=Trifolium pratense TaxID=57577 RepID=A0A2K3MCN0_TRIPR|nr:hypothetical protein L195_g044660 [Trifolium pratense]
MVWREYLKKCGDGSDTLFWIDPWLGESPLCERFRRLFDLSENKSGTVAEMTSLGWETGGGVGVAEAVVGLGGGVVDFSVRDAYQVLTSQDSVILDACYDLVWHKKLFLVLLDVESAHHLFLSCSTYGSLWVLVRSWIGVSMVDYTSLGDHFVQFTSSAGCSRARRSFMQLIWLACVWIIWTERNHRLFGGSASTSHQLLDKIKLFSYRWLKTTNVTLVSSYHSWWSDLYFV